MKRRSSKQPTDKKPILDKELWREIPDKLQGKVRGGSEPLTVTDAFVT